MKCPPYLVSLRIAEGERTRFRLWFPLFILWPPLLALLLLTLATTLLADLFTEVFIKDRSHHSRTVAFTLR